MALWRAKDKPPVELVVANLNPFYEGAYLLAEKEENDFLNTHYMIDPAMS